MIVPEGASVPASPGPGGAQDLTVRAHEQDGAVVLEVSGEIDMLTAPRLREAVWSALDGRPGVVVVDLLEVTFLGSSGLAVLVEAQQRAVERTALRIVATGAATMRPLQITGLDRHVSVFATRSDALAG